MSFNNASIILTLAEKSENVKPTYGRRQVRSEPCLSESLPTTNFILREAESLAPKELTRQLLKQSIEDDLVDKAIADNEYQHRTRKESSPRSSSSVKSFVQSIISPRIGQTSSSDWANLQPYEIMKAIEEKDITFLMEVRDNAFPLLLQSSGGETPLVHAIRTGNKDVAIVLLGAFSRWVNYLEDTDIRKPQNQTYLKALRVGLKLAINEGLAKSQSDLIASFMQTLVMSEGDKWVYAQVSTVSRALNAGKYGKPVQVAGACVRRFATKELGKADLIASLEDYVSNATADLLMMGAWAIALQSFKGEPLPSYYFARDDRVYKNFVDRIDRYSTEIKHSCTSQLRWQLQVLKNGLGGRSLTFRRKIELLANQLEED